MDSILDSIKKLIGIDYEYDAFDTDLIIHINSAFSTLMQLGVGPPEGFVVKDREAKWSEFLNNSTRLESVKTYVYLKVRLVFDPPQSSSVIKAYEDMIKELEWRINVTAETE